MRKPYFAHKFSWNKAFVGKSSVLVISTFMIQYQRFNKENSPAKSVCSFQICFHDLFQLAGGVVVFLNVSKYWDNDSFYVINFNIQLSRNQPPLPTTTCRRQQKQLDSNFLPLQKNDQKTVGINQIDCITRVFWPKKLQFCCFRPLLRKSVALQRKSTAPYFQVKSCGFPKCLDAKKHLDINF